MISTDFCHWGARFRYQHYEEADGEIWESIRALDMRGFAEIQKQDPLGFATYLKDTNNTICGRFAVAVFLSALEASGLKTNTELLRYSQSEKVKTASGSSVSYVAGCTTLLKE